MKSDIYTEKHGISEILTEVENIGKLCKLSPSASGKLRLLTEEMLGLTVRLFEDLRYEFFVEGQGKRYTLNLVAETNVSQTKKDKMLSLSTSGKNKANQGLFGRISGIFEGLLTNDCGYEAIHAPYYDGLGMNAYFSLSAYRDQISQYTKEEQEIQWDGLEKSIIANLAKDVIIGVRNSKAEMIVIVEF
ncbi:MAG: hypothetical protein FWH20_03750 [Oscillospiraceae bacterium]|nr:hypothetical protein [Oscillospiraceae bacterium]